MKKFGKTHSEDDQLDSSQVPRVSLCIGDMKMCNMRRTVRSAGTVVFGGFMFCCCLFL